MLTNDEVSEWDSEVTPDYLIQEHFELLRDMQSDPLMIKSQQIKFAPEPCITNCDQVLQYRVNKKFEELTIGSELDQFIESDEPFRNISDMLTKVIQEVGHHIKRLNINKCTREVWEYICEYCVNLEVLRVNLRMVEANCSLKLKNLREIEMFSVCCGWHPTSSRLLINIAGVLQNNDKVEKIIINGIEETGCGCGHCTTCFDWFVYVDTEILKIVCDYARRHANRRIAAILGVKRWQITFPVPDNLQLLINFEPCCH